MYKDILLIDVIFFAVSLSVSFVLVDLQKCFLVIFKNIVFYFESFLHVDFTNHPQLPNNGANFSCYCY